MLKMSVDKNQTQNKNQTGEPNMKKDNTKFQKIGNSTGILIPADVVKDSTFPLQLDDEVVVEIVGNKVIVSKAPDLTNNKKVSDYVKP